MIIDNQSIAPGEDMVIKIPAGRLPSDTRIQVYVHVYRSEKPGPILFVQGGVHGDEINGIEIVRRAIENNLFKNIDCGSVIAVPLLNIFGFINFSRDVPDGKDVNRSFPGNLSGSLASRVARVLTKKILPNVDVALDCHTGGSSRYNFPQIRYNKNDKKAEILAQMFNAPFAVEKPYIAHSFRKSANEMGIPAIVFEGGESVRLDGLAIDHGLRGLQNLMAGLGIISENKKREIDSLTISNTSWIRASQSGIFIWSKSSGNKIYKGEPLGEIKDPFGTKSVKVLSKHNGYIIGHNNASVVNQGDALFHVGFLKNQ
ncbi:MAG: succinylglutamate desuccinylase/aspartoacylase family protein [Saprospiraceae bacterium]|nr:succinylglutamate desuccinylase/aspartoacylase family protein [Saprospiraceae bacterium]MCB9327959.1 succinylglutamate desuccinylase/aspartoacylase family protein [Lewinellaceae bacterium]